MTDALRAVPAFLAADLTALAGLPGLPPDLPLSDLAELEVDTEISGLGIIGDGRQATWLAADSGPYEGGVRVWVDGERVLLLEGRDPIDGDGEPLSLPDLGAPEAVRDTVLDRLVLPGGEHVHASRGLAIRVNPDNGIVLGVLVFAPTTVSTYDAGLRPRLEPRRLLAAPTSAHQAGGLR